MDTLPYELLIKIAIELRYGDIVNFCLTSEHCKSIYYDSYFWRTLSYYKFDIHVDKRERFLELYCNITLRHPPGAEVMFTLNRCIFMAALNNNRSDVDYFLNKGGAKDIAFVAAVVGNHVELATDLMIEPDKYAFGVALELENYKMIEYLLPRIDNVDGLLLTHGTVNSINFVRKRMTIDEHKLIYYAIERGDMAFLKVILKEEFKIELDFTIDKLDEFLIKVGPMYHLLASLLLTDFNYLMLSIGQGQLDYIRQLLSSRTDIDIINILILTAAQTNQLDILRYLISLGNFDLHRALEISVRKGHMNIVKYLNDCGVHNIGLVYMWAAFRRDQHMLNYIVKKLIEI